MLRDLLSIDLSHRIKMQIYGNHSAPFEYVQPEFRIVVPLVSSIAKIDNGRTGSIVKWEDESDRCGRCSERGDDSSEQ